MTSWSGQLRPLIALQLFADAVGGDLIPIDFCPRDRQLSPQSLESCLGHGLIVLTNASLVFLLSLLHDPH